MLNFNFSRNPADSHHKNVIMFLKCSKFCEFEKSCEQLCLQLTNLLVSDLSKSTKINTDIETTLLSILQSQF